MNNIFIEVPSFAQILDFVGSFAFAISGIRLASGRKFDVFGAYVVGLTTAVGGGTLRDLLLRQTPFWMVTPVYLICTGLAVLWVAGFGKKLIRQNNTWFLFDTIGLAVFTVSGMEKTFDLGFPWWTAIVMGTMTGAEIYASACLVGGGAYMFCDLMGCDHIISGIVCGLTVIVVRLLAVKYKLSLPHLRGE